MIDSTHEIFKPIYKNSLKYALKHVPEKFIHAHHTTGAILKNFASDPELITLIKSLPTDVVIGSLCSVKVFGNLYEHGYFESYSFDSFIKLFTYFVDYKSPKKDFKKFYRSVLTEENPYQFRLYEHIEKLYSVKRKKELIKHIRYCCKYFPITELQPHASIIKHYSNYPLLKEYLKYSKLPIPWEELFERFNRISREGFYKLTSITNRMRKYKNVSTSYDETRDYYEKLRLEKEEKELKESLKNFKFDEKDFIKAALMGDAPMITLQHDHSTYNIHHDHSTYNIHHDNPTKSNDYSKFYNYATNDINNTKNMFDNLRKERKECDEVIDTGDYGLNRLLDNGIIDKDGKIIEIGGEAQRARAMTEQALARSVWYEQPKHYNHNFDWS